MRLLLDTQMLLWSVAEPIKLPPAGRALIEDDDHERLFSAANMWEIAIKSALGRPDFDTEPRRFLERALTAGFRELPVTSWIAARVAILPHHHRDPFDRLLVAQAIEEDAVLLTADRALARYGPHVRLAE